MPGLFPEDEEESFAELAGLQAPMLRDPGALAMATAPIDAQLPSVEPQRTPEMDAFEALAGVGEPPEAKNRDWDRAGLILAMFADAIAGGGMRAGENIENYQLKMSDAYKRAQIANMLQESRGHQADPQVLAIRQAENDARLKQLAFEEKRLEAREKGEALSPAEQLARERFDWEESRAEKQAADGGLTPYQKESLELRKQAALNSSATRTAAEGARSAAQQAQSDQRFATNAGKYWNDTEYYRTGAQAMQQLDGVLGKYKEGDDLPAVGMIDSRIPKWALEGDGLAISSAQDWMNNAIQRAESGAAAPIPEELGYKIRTGSAPGATEAQFREGVRAAREYLKGQLSSRASGMESEARDVLKRQGLDSWVFGAQPPPPQATGPGLGTTEGVPGLEAVEVEDEWEDL
jgi:hypothetical protein